MANSTQKLNNNAAASMIREEDLEDLEELLKNLQNRVDQAHQDGRVYLMSQYVRLVALVSPEIDKIHRRFKRENLAAMRKLHQELKLEHRAANGANE
jgi:hypothetical protein